MQTTAVELAVAVARMVVMAAVARETAVVEARVEAALARRRVDTAVARVAVATEADSEAVGLAETEAGSEAVEWVPSLADTVAPRAGAVSGFGTRRPMPAGRSSAARHPLRHCCWKCPTATGSSPWCCGLNRWQSWPHAWPSWRHTALWRPRW